MLNIIYNNFMKLKECNTKKDKETALKELGKDDNSIYVLDFLLDKQLKTGISRSKINKNIDMDLPTDIPATITDLILYLLHHNTGRDIDIAITQHFIKQLDNEMHQQFVKQIITKTFKCGVTAKVASEIIPSISRPWEMRKGHTIKDIKKQLSNKDLIVTLKVDGFRYPVIKYSNDNIKIYSSTGYVDDTLTEIINEFKNPNIPTGVYDCECVAIGDFATSTERYNATSKILSTKANNKTGIEMECFDYIEDIQAFLTYNKYNVPCIDRKQKAQDIILNKDNTRKYKYINYLIPMAHISSNTSIEDIERTLDSIFEKVVEKGEEGLVVDIANAPYERKKGNTMYKMKPVLTGDFKVVGLNKGKSDSKYKDVLGAFIIEYKNNTVNIGSGIPDELREEVWNNKEYYINKLIEVAYSFESEDEDGNPSLRLPRFVRLRHDKDPDDVSYD